MTRPRRAVIPWVHRLALAVCLAAAVPRVALAQTAADHAQAEKLKAAADDAMDNLRYAEALEGYRKAYALSKDPRDVYNMGRALGALGNYPEAVSELERFQQDAPPSLLAKVPKLQGLIDNFRQHVSSLTVTSNVPGARVLVRDKAVGQTPLTGIKLNSGAATIEVNAPDYVSEKRQVTLPMGGNLALTFELKRATPTGVLVVHSTPGATSTLVDGKLLGGTPLSVSLLPGTHRLLLRRDGYYDLATSAVVERGEHRAVDLRLERTPAIYQRWWFWTAIGVAVAGGVALTVALLTERGADSGDIPPGQVRGPLTF